MVIQSEIFQEKSEDVKLVHGSGKYPAHLIASTRRGCSQVDIPNPCQLRFIGRRNDPFHSLPSKKVDAGHTIHNFDEAEIQDCVAVL